MNRQRGRNLQQQADSMRATLDKDLKPVEADVPLKVLQQVKEGMWGESQIGCVAKFLLAKKGFQQQHLIVGNFSSVVDTLKNESTPSPTFVVCKIDDDKWVSLCLLKKDNNLTVLYKDPQGLDASESIKRQLGEIYQQNFNVQFKFHRSGEIVTKYDSSFVTLRNIHLMFKEYKKNGCVEKMIDCFDSMKFCLKSNIDHFKKKYAKKLEANFRKTIAQMVSDISAKPLFLKEIQKFLNDYNDIDPSCQAAKKLCILFDNDPNNKKNDLLAEPDEATLMKYRNMKESLMSDPNYSKLLNEKNDSKFFNYKDIQNNYKEESDKFHDIFEFLWEVEDNSELDKGLKTICEKLDLNLENVKKFFESRRQEKIVEQNIEHSSLETLVPIPIKDVHVKSEMMTLDSVRQDNDCKSVDELLQDESFMAHVCAGTSSADRETVTNQYKRYFKDVERFNKKWIQKTVDDVNAWSKSKMRNLTSEDEIEAIAVMDRANELVTTHRLRRPQVLTLLTFLRFNISKGLLFQIHTGEGKTVIISMIAVIKALRGRTVDIITSNPVLASQGVDDRKSFYSIFNLTVSHNNQDESAKCTTARSCYTANIVYGCISSYQFDYLRDVFEGQNTRADRPFQSTIIDEVDSMLVDNGGQIAKLSSHFPGMELLRYIYIQIWKQLCVEGDKLLSEAQREINYVKGNLAEQLSDRAKNIVSQVKDIIKKSNPTNIPFIPSHLKDYANKMVDKWIDNAIYAAYQCQQYVHYTIKAVRVDGREELQIVPIDYANTGVTLKNTVWSHGLHQFVQLKHNLRLTSETLTSCCISNYEYINMYKDCICGLTGTLGSAPEQNLLSTMYKVTFVYIPTYKEKKFIEMEAIVANSEKNWRKEVLNEIVKVTQEENRAVLVICETQSDLMGIQETIEQHSLELTQLQLYRDEEEAEVTLSTISPGCVVLATNIAGRGADFHTSPELQEHGGLHVCITFLPANERVKQQAQFRTSRQGNSGSARLIVKKSQIQRMGIPVNQSNLVNFQMLKSVIELYENKRIQNILDVQLKELTFHDRLYKQFSTLYRNAKQRFAYEQGMQYVLRDLKEYFAFWIEGLPEKEYFKKTPEETFRKFKNDVKTQHILNGSIQHNAFYSIQQAEYFMRSGKSRGRNVPAENALHHAIQLSNNPNVLHSAYFKLYELAMNEGDVLMNKLKSALQDLVGYSPPNRANNEYKTKGRKYLDLASEALSTEINYITSTFEDEQFRSIIIDLKGKENFLITHLQSRLTTLQIYYTNILHLNRAIAESRDEGVAISSRVPNYLENLQSSRNDRSEEQEDASSAGTSESGNVLHSENGNTNQNEEIMLDTVRRPELRELASVGLDTVQDVRVVPNVSQATINASRIQIAGGLSLLGSSALFPPAALVTTPLASTMISEGIMDLVTELMGATAVGSMYYVTGKIVTYGISILTMGLNVLTTCTRYLEEAIRTCTRLSSLLRSSTTMVGLCQKLAVFIESIKDILIFIKSVNLNLIIYGTRTIAFIQEHRQHIQIGGTAAAALFYFLFRNRNQIGHNHDDDDDDDDGTEDVFDMDDVVDKNDDTNVYNQQSNAPELQNGNANRNETINYENIDQHGHDPVRNENEQNIVDNQNGSENIGINAEDLEALGTNAWSNGWEAENNNKPDEAKKCFEKALEHFLEAKSLSPNSDAQYDQWVETIKCKIEGNENYNTALTYQELALEYKKNKMFLEAKYYFQKTLNAFTRGRELTSDHRFDDCIEEVETYILEINNLLTILKINEVALDVGNMTVGEYVRKSASLPQTNETISQHTSEPVMLTASPSTSNNQ